MNNSKWIFARKTGQWISRRPESINQRDEKKRQRRSSPKREPFPDAKSENGAIQKAGPELGLQKSGQDWLQTLDFFETTML